MKVLFLLVAGILSAGSAFGQSVVFANTVSADFRIYTNTGAGGCGLMTGLNQWRIGLYAGSLGASEGSLVLVGLATNRSAPVLAGYFSGGSPFFLPAPYTTGDTITFQVRAWAFGGGVDYFQALLNGYAVGKSALGFVTLGGGIVFPGPLFGTSPGQIGGFTIGGPLSGNGNCVPEPSTYALGLLGVILFGLLGLKRR